jgi:hypothetical protein
VTVFILLAAASVASAQTSVDMALSFYSNGGAYCFRIAPSGTSLAEEREWTVMVLTSASNHHNTYRIRSVDPGGTGLSGSGLLSAGRFANDVWKFDGTRGDFFERFAEGIRTHKLRARVVKTEPPGLAQLATDRERAEFYLRFADKGTKVSFDKVPDLTPGEFQQFSDYVPD